MILLFEGIFHVFLLIFLFCQKLLILHLDIAQFIDILIFGLLDSDLNLLLFLFQESYFFY